jgi:hypothetical protein
VVVREREEGRRMASNKIRRKKKENQSERHDSRLRGMRVGKSKPNELTCSAIHYVIRL